MKQLSCDQCRARWDELISKSTFEADPQFADVRAHLESCADCRKSFDLLVAARLELQQSPSLKAPASLRANIFRQIEKPQRQSVPWWRSLFVSPQRLAWASGAIVTVFVVALLMRPEHQRQVVQTAPKVLSNRGQVEEHNNLPPQLSVAPSKPTKDSTEKKVLPKKSQTTTGTKSPTTKLRRKKSSASDKSKQQQEAITPALQSHKNVPEPSAKYVMPSPPKIQTPRSLELQKSVAPPAPLNNSVTSEAAGRTNQDSANQPTSQYRSMKKGASAPRGSFAAAPAFKSNSLQETIHWSKTITSDYDVANAKIIVTLEEGLKFADESHENSQRTLWQGTLFRGKKIPLNVELHRTSKKAVKLHLEMIDTTTQKVLLDKNVTLSE